MFSKTATAGHAPDYAIPASNLASFIASDPFARGSPLLTAKKAGLRQATPLTKPLFIDPATSSQLTRGQLELLALSYAAGLRHRLGLLPAPMLNGRTTIVSPIVLVHLPNCLAFPVVAFGVLAAGLTLTLANPSLTPTELAHVLRKSRPAAIFSAQPKAMGEAIALVGETELKQRYDRTLFAVDPEDANFTKVDVDERDHRHLLRPVNSSRFQIAELTEEEARRRVAIILWSSGTTGASKGVLLSHYAFVSGACIPWHGNPDLADDQVFLAFAPFFHIFGLAQILVYGICIGATTIIMRRFEPKAMLDYIARYRVTFLHHAPPTGIFLSKSPLIDAADLSSFRFTMSGGAPLGTDVIESVYKRTGIIIRMGYGTSEAGSLTSQQGDTWEELGASLGTAGRPLPGVQFTIISIDGKDEVLKVDEEGEILLKTPAAMLGYLDSPEADAATFTSDGWIRTGDIGLIDTHGNLRITDRLKELIKVKGFQVTPAELEGVLCGSPLVADAGVCGIPDPARASEKPRAWIVLTNLARSMDRVQLAEELRRHLETRLVAYKRITGNFCIIDVVPKSVAGKILRRELKTCQGEELELYDEDGRAIGKAKL